MPPALAAAAKNTNAVAEGEIIMTDEELQQTIQELGDSIDKLSDPDKPLTKEEKNRRHILSLRKETLQRITEAREKNNVNLEMTHTITYGLLSALGEKHPLLLHFLQSKFRMNIF